MLCANAQASATLPVDKGDKVAFRDKYQEWWFVMHSKDGITDYGWLPENVLTRCKKMDGTPWPSICVPPTVGETVRHD